MCHLLVESHIKQANSLLHYAFSEHIGTEGITEIDSNATKCII